MRALALVLAGMSAAACEIEDCNEDAVSRAGVCFPEGDLLEHGERSRARLAHGEDAEAGRIVGEELRGVVRHLLCQLGAAVHDEQVGLDEGLALERGALQLFVDELRRERMNVEALELPAPRQPGDHGHERDAEGDG